MAVAPIVVDSSRIEAIARDIADVLNDPKHEHANTAEVMMALNYVNHRLCVASIDALLGTSTRSNQEGPR